MNCCLNLLTLLLRPQLQSCDSESPWLLTLDQVHSYEDLQRDAMKIDFEWKQLALQKQFKKNNKLLIDILL